MPVPSGTPLLALEDCGSDPAESTMKFCETLLRVDTHSYIVVLNKTKQAKLAITSGNESPPEVNSFVQLAHCAK